VLGEALSTEETAPVLATAAEALSKLRDGMSPDVVVMDLDVRDGAAVLAEAQCAMADLIPVVALSSNPRRLLAAGIADAVCVT
jgi:CheY-like chemotaxis protein